MSDLDAVPLDVMARFLLLHLPWLRHHEAVNDLADELHHHTTAARHIIDAPTNRTTIPVGPCPETACPGEVRAHIPADPNQTAHMTCTGPQHHRLETWQWARAGQRILALKARRSTA